MLSNSLAFKRSVASKTNVSRGGGCRQVGAVSTMRSAQE